MLYCIYKHTNNVTGKVYIGQTKHTENPNIRWQNGKGYKNNKLFFTDISTYGWDNFTHEIIQICSTIEKANSLERLYIKKFHSDDPNFGYNQTSGGGNYEVGLKTEFCYNDKKGLLRSVKSDNFDVELQRYEEKYNKLF